VPSDGIAKGVRLAAALARKAQAKGVAFEGGVTVTGFEVHDGRVTAVRTDRGDVGCERVLLCAGIWGPTVGAMAGVPIPLLAVQHQLVWTDPIPELEGETREVVHPILRHQDMAMYFRHRGDHYAVGNYKHEPIATAQSDLRHPSSTGPMPSLMPWTPRDFDVAEAEAARLLPSLAGRMRPSDASRSINGMFSFTPDAGSIVGESAKVRGFWICEAVWVTHGGGMGRQVAEWMALGEPSYDLAEADANRFYPYATTPPYVLERGKQQYREVYDIIHPLQQMTSPRRLRLTPFSSQHRELGAEFFSAAGWERPHWFEGNRELLRGDPWEDRDPWAARFWSPIVGAEHLATREGVALFDITPYGKFVARGPDAGTMLERICGNLIDRPIGKVVYTAMLTPSGGIRCDLTVTPLSETSFGITTGGGSAMHDLAWWRSQVRDHERVVFEDWTAAELCLGLWGPHARDVLAATTQDDVSNDSFPYMTGREITVGEVPVFAQRLSYVGELGWELYAPVEMGDRLWHLLWEAGRPHGIIAAGGGAFDSLRLEKGFRLWGQDINPERDPFSAGLGFAVKMDKPDFQGKARLEEILERGLSERLCCMVLDDPANVVMGKEPIWAGDRVVSYVTSANYGYSIGRGIVYGYLPVELAAEGTQVEVEYFGERYGAHVTAEPLWDPKGERLKA
jgi:glycine cleavage system aminomethyltransferase T